MSECFPQWSCIKLARYAVACCKVLAKTSSIKSYVTVWLSVAVCYTSFVVFVLQGNQK